jgi:hypothetical protein
MARSCVHEQRSHPILPPAKLQKLSLYYSLSEAATICIECGFALSPKLASEHPGKKHGIARSARHGLKPLLSSLNLPDPDALSLLCTVVQVFRPNTIFLACACVASFSNLKFLPPPPSPDTYRNSSLSVLPDLKVILILRDSNAAVLPYPLCKTPALVGSI